LLYFAWSRPGETGASLTVIDDRFPSIFELRRLFGEAQMLEIPVELFGESRHCMAPSAVSTLDAPTKKATELHERSTWAAAPRERLDVL